MVPSPPPPPPECSPPSLGFGASGAWALSLYPEQKAQQIIDEAISLGIRHFDTAGFYNQGRAEERLGSTLKRYVNDDDIRPTLTISTKIGKTIDTRGRLNRDFRPPTIDRTIKQSCSRLGVETLDVVYLHGPDKHEISSSLPHLLALKEKGRIGAIGICSDAEPLRTAIDLPEIDVLMGRFNLFDQRNAETFARAKAGGKRTVAIAPLAQALWRRSLFTPRGIPDLWYTARAAVRNRREWVNAQRARWLHRIDGWTAAELAVAFVASSPNIDVMITTTTRPAHLRETAAARLRPLPEVVRSRIYG